MIRADATVRRGEFELALRFSAPSGAVCALFGASGSGKSTALALLGGALRPDSGRIEFQGETLSDAERGIHVPMEQRRFGWVFQDGRLFPHMTATQNLDFGALRVPRGSARNIERARAIEVLGLGALLHRRPYELSGGERQRVAIGRALLSQPRLLLLDEPLASLDAPRKSEILAFLERVKAEFRIAAVYVTHSLGEVLRLADHLALLDQGKVVAEGATAAMLGKADTPLLGQRADAGSLLEGTIAATDRQPSAAAGGALAVGDSDSAPTSDLRLALGDGQSLLVPAGSARPGDALRVYVRANEVLLATERPRAISVRNVLAGKVIRIVGSPSESAGASVEIAVGHHRLLARVTHAAVAELNLHAGGAVFALVKSMAIDAPAGRDELQ